MQSAEDEDMPSDASSSVGETRVVDPVRARDKLRRAGFAYLQRYATSRSHFETILIAKARRWVDRGFLPVGAAEAEVLARAVVAEFEALGLIEDRAYAEARVASATRKGQSRLRIRQTLRQKGVDAETVEAALGAAEIDETVAALRLARRKRLGPWRRLSADDRATLERKEIAVLMRQGFGYGLARRVVAMALDEAEAVMAGEAFE